MTSPVATFTPPSIFMSYFYLIEVDPQSPLDKDIELDLAQCILDTRGRGYRDYYRVTADSVPEAVRKILINDRLLVQRKADLMSVDLSQPNWNIGEPK